MYLPTFVVCCIVKDILGQNDFGSHQMFALGSILTPEESAHKLRLCLVRGERLNKHK